MKTPALLMTSAAHRRRLAAAGAAAAMFALAACSSTGGDSKDAAPAGSGAPSAAAAGPKVIEATNGKVTVPAGVKRIVSVSYATGALLDLGVQPVGTSTIDESNPMELLPAQKEAAAKIEPIGSGIEINIEKVASLKPDLIVVEGATAFDWGIKKLEGIAPTLYFGVDHPVDLYNAQEKIATAVGKDAEFAKLKSDYAAKAAKIKTDYAAKLNSLKWTIASSYGGGEYLIDTSSSWVGRVLTDVGAQFSDAAKDGTEHEVTLSTEKLDALGDADIILVPRTAATGEVPADTKDLEKQPAWQQLKAVKANKVVPVTYATTDRYGTSIDLLNQIETILKAQ
ncbi:ABC transporter substrate-binding protein [Kitasatospora sp. MBT63]|uniref:ABC transporter substrate-binding protein n=1 Tax=Kitasatospora sp. MBT63 TaxID=1444768 RepID=UPI000539A4C6|nr:ABC transporter substrate-binding protein [Kitasatospora sp. MBT63]